MSPFQKAEQAAEEKRKKLEEQRLERERKEREREVKQRQRKIDFKRASKRTRKGQPVMSAQIDRLLEKIRHNTSK